MRLESVCTLLLLALLLSGCSCVVWGPKESPSGVRGHGQRTPQVFEIPAGEPIEDELQSITSQLTASDSSGLKRFKRQSSGDIGYAARLTNDSHYQAVVHWTGHPSEGIFIVTRKLNSNGHSDESWLWRSTDYGQTFNNETNKLPSDAVVEWYKISPFSEYLIFTDIKHDRVYITEDEGESYTVVATPFTPNTLLFQSILAPNSTDSPYNKYVLGYDSAAQTLWVSVDLGRNWNKIGNNVSAGRYYWRRLGSDTEGDLSTVYHEQRTSANTSRLYMWHSGMAVGQEFSSDLGEFRSMSFVLEHEYMFVQKPETTNVGAFLSPLWVSHNRSSTFVQAGFPFVTEQQHYSVIDASEGQVFIAVYHIGNTSNLYISEEKGVNYSLTLQDIVSPPEQNWVNGNPTIDVHVVEGVVGTYFANRHAVGSRYGSTVVSFDKGGRWNLLTPPALNYYGRPIVCAPPDCSLHLHMDIDAQSRSYQSILSQDSAIGLIMAQGNLGSTLSSSTWRTRLYFSRDGGFTWAEVRRGLYEFQFAALGSIVVAVQKRSYVRNVLWSCNEGATWNSSSFVSNDFRFGIVVIGMRTEAGEKARHVTVFGYDRSGGRFSEWLVFDLDFTSVVPRQCDADEGYYDWIPTDERPGSRCLLGEVVAYERRNASECCYVDPNYEKGIERNTCKCAIEDFECDFGFERDNLNSPCNPYPGRIYPPVPPDDCPENETYTYSSGYRKIAGDKCVPGTETYFFPIVRSCPIRPPRFLVIGYSPGLVKAGDPVTFTLTQFDGAVKNTNYTWRFNDSTDPVTVPGLANARQQIHTFTRPGVYVVTLTAFNEAGTSEVVQTVRVLDEVSGVEIVPPSQVFNGEVPATISLLFSATVTSQHNTALLDIREYQWDFGDGTPPSSSDIPTVSHTYSTSGTYTVSLTVHAPFVSGNGQASLDLIVYKATSVVDVVSDNSALVTNGGTTYIPVNSKVTFSPQPQQSGVQLPPDTVNTWHVVKTSPVGDGGVNRTVANLTYSFTSWGAYHISVIGRSSHAGASFVGERYVTAESKISKVEVKHVPTVRTGSSVTLDFTVTGSEAGSYDGPLTLSVLVNGTVVVSSTRLSAPGQVSTLNLEVSGRGVVEYQFKANNEVSSSKGKTTINVVDFGEYASLTIQFSSLPPSYNNSAWQERLKKSVVKAITSVNPTALVEVVGVRAVKQNATRTDSPDLLKRAAESTKVVYLYVDVNILPTEYTEVGISNAKSLAELIVIEAKNGSLTVIVDGETLTIRSATTITGGVIIEPGGVRVYTQTAAAIGGALGGFIIITIVLTVVLVLIVYFYRRKYTRLHVRYSRLQQTPVRFTFTPGGEMVEEEDDYDEDADDEEVDDFKMKPT